MKKIDTSFQGKQFGGYINETAARDGQMLIYICTCSATAPFTSFKTAVVSTTAVVV